MKEVVVLAVLCGMIGGFVGSAFETFGAEKCARWREAEKNLYFGTSYQCMEWKP